MSPLRLRPFFCILFLSIVKPIRTKFVSLVPYDPRASFRNTSTRLVTAFASLFFALQFTFY